MKNYAIVQMFLYFIYLLNSIIFIGGGVEIWLKIGGYGVLLVVLQIAAYIQR